MPQLKRVSLGFTLIEIVVSLAIIAVAFLGIGYIFARGIDYGSRLASRAIDLNLARDLIEEIKTRPWEEPDLDPDQPLPPLGPDEGETSRKLFDDVDDYHNWSQSPPQTVEGISMDGQEHDGKTYPDYTGFTRSVTVEYVLPDDFTQTTGSDIGYKRITVEVSFENKSDRLVLVVADKEGEEEE